MPPEVLKILQARIEEAIGGRSRAPAFDRETSRRFKRTTIQSWIDGKTWPDMAELQALADEVKLPLAWFLGLETPKPVVLEPPGTVIIPVLDVTAAAGFGTIADVVRAEAEFAFPTYFLEKLLGRETAGHARLESLRSKGDSMLPTIADGALLIIDRHQRQLPSAPEPSKKTYRNHQASGIWVFQLGEHVRLKRLRRVDEQYVAAISDNIENYPVEVFRPGADGAFEILGKVIWWDNRL